MPTASIPPSSSQVILLRNGKGGVDNNGFVGGANKDPDYDMYHDSDWMLEQSQEEIITIGGFTWPSIREKVKSGCTRTAWRKRLPITYWLPKYSLRDFRGDLVAGLTVGLTVVPQGLAYAAIAQVPLEVRNSLLLLRPERFGNFAILKKNRI
jgi:hypothetical protein